MVLPAPVQARKEGYRLKGESATAKKGNDKKGGSASMRGTGTVVVDELNMEDYGDGFIVVTAGDTIKPYTLRQIRFAGYDKKPRVSKESLFITNTTDRTLTALSFDIEYLTMSGRQLNRRRVALKCNIPAGETRLVSIDSWDEQRSFHYHRSDRGKASTTPYDIRLHPRCIVLL